MISVGIIGGSGYTGKYILKFCNQHPNVKEYEIYANKSANKTVHDVFPELVGEVGDKTIKSISEIDFSHDLYFFALPHGESLKYIPLFIGREKKVIDLGADFRLDDSEEYLNIYQLSHNAPQLLKTKKYGLAEVHNQYDTNLIANPGCYPTAALLSTIPVVKNYSHLIQSISTVAYSGLSGAGKKVTQSMLFSENYNSVKAYNVGAHRHEVEIKQELNKLGSNLNYSLTTHLLPIFSGIYSTTIIHLSENLSQDEISNKFQTEYQNSEFIRLRTMPPELKWVIGSNYCDINVTCSSNKVIVTTAIDNLIKGAAGQAIQNMNKLYGWNESLGITIFKEEFQNV